MDKQFTGAVSVWSEGGKSIALATDGEQVVMVVPHDHVELDGSTQILLSEEEAWCLARQLDLACRRLRRVA